MNVIQDLSKDIRKEDRKRQAENKSDKIKEQIDEIRLRNRLSRARAGQECQRRKRIRSRKWTD